MTSENYLIIENNVVTNVVLWDGDASTWQPPEGSTTLPLATTPAMIWMLTADETDYVLTEVMGAGGMYFTWNGTVLVCPDEKPIPPDPIPTTGPI